MKFRVITTILFLVWSVSHSIASVGLIKVEGAIGPATANYIERAIKVAATRGDSCLVIQLDTPGGLLESTKQIVQTFYESRVPIVVHVAPAGATATSAGCFITLAANFAAMAPNTSIGAAHPVSLGGGNTEKPDDIMRQKLENYAASYIQTIAEKRGRNIEWAISAVTNSTSVTAEKAVELKIVDFLASNTTELLAKLDGRPSGDKALQTIGQKVEEIPMLPRERIFQLLWRPEVLLVLTLAAIYGIIGELSNPGSILPGVVGGISLILVLYMSSILPVNVAGLALMGLALVLFAIDVFAPTHGVLTAGGIGSFFLGAIMLFDKPGSGLHLSLGYIIPATLLTAAFFLFVVGAGVRAQYLPVRTGTSTLLGRTVEALMPIDSTTGKVFVEGEYWNAVCQTPVGKGEPVEIVGVEGLTLHVKPKTA